MKESPRALVLDASATIPLLLGTRAPGLAELVESLARVPAVWVPTLHAFEVANALWKYVASGHITAADAQKALARASNLTTEVAFDLDLHLETLAIATRYSHPVYDASYVALARRKTASLASFDARLRELAIRTDIALVP